MTYRNPFNTGLGKLIDNDFSSFGNKSQSYPPMNILYKDNIYRLEYALAGFSKDQISVEEYSGYLVVSGDKGFELENESEWRYIHGGIAGRSFQHKFHLGKNLLIGDVRFRDGILSIDLKVDENGNGVNKIPIN